MRVETMALCVQYFETNFKTYYIGVSSTNSESILTNISFCIHNKKGNKQT